MSALVRTLDDPDDAVRKEAIRSLIQIASPEAIPALSRLVAGDEDDIRLLAAYGLGRISGSHCPPVRNGKLRKAG